MFIFFPTIAETRGNEYQPPRPLGFAPNSSNTAAVLSCAFSAAAASGVPKRLHDSQWLAPRESTHANGICSTFQSSCLQGGSVPAASPVDINTVVDKKLCHFGAALSRRDVERLAQGSILSGLRLCRRRSLPVALHLNHRHRLCFLGFPPGISLRSSPVPEKQISAGRAP